MRLGVRAGLAAFKAARAGEDQSQKIPSLNFILHRLVASLFFCLVQ